MPEDTVTIPKAEYEELKDEAKWMRAYDDAGVDNWDGTDYARELYESYDD